MNILYINSDSNETTSFKNNIDSMFNILHASNVSDAFILINSIVLDCIVIDYNVGFDVVSFFKNTKETRPTISRILIVNKEESERLDNIEHIDLADIMFVLTKPYKNLYLHEVVKMACLANGNDKRALFFSVTETVLNKIENLSLKEQFLAQEQVLRQYLEKLFEEKEKKIKLQNHSLKIRESKFKAIRLSWKATIVVRAILFAVVSAFIGAYKAELTKSFIDLIRIFDE